jgi:hypothetical protein
VSNHTEINKNQMASGEYVIEEIDQNGFVYRKK